MPDSLHEAVTHAFDAIRFEDVISRVHGAVFESLKDLDATAKIERTNYFNHSYIPDFVLTWPEANSKARREVFLRYDLESAQAAGDVRGLGDQGGVLLSLDTNENAGLDDAKAIAPEVPRLLMTDVKAIDVIALAPPDDGLRSPLRGLVRANLVRGGRGVLDEQAATSITTALDSSSVSDEVHGLEGFEQAVEEHFLPDAAYRLERASRLIRLSLQQDEQGLASLLGSSTDGESGRLSKAELLALVPYLLARQQEPNPRFWRYIGSLIDLRDLESMWAELSDIDLTPIASANAGVWLATRGQLNINIEWLNADTDGAPLPRDGWQMHAHMLALSLGGLRLHVAADRRKVRPREGGRAVALDEISPVLERRKVHSVSLEGIERAFDVRGVRQADVFSDITAVQNSISDRYFVPTVTVGAESGDDKDGVKVDFTTQTVESVGNATVRDLAQAAFDLLGRQEAWRTAALSALLGQSDGSPPLEI